MINKDKDKGKDKDKLLDLIEKFQSGVASKEEMSKIFNFFLNNQKKLEFPGSLEERKRLKQRVLKRVEIKEKLKGKVVKINSRKKYWNAVAVAAGLLLLITIPIIKNTLAKESSGVVSNNHIEAGKNRAVLTLTDGSELILDQYESQVAENFVNDGKKIVYSTTKTIENNANKEKDNKEENINYHYLTIPRGGQYTLTLSDGTKVWLNSQSKLKYPVEFPKGKPRIVDVLYGEAYFEVSHSENNNGSHFFVNTGKQKIEVLGTKFNVKAHKDESSIYTTLVEGSVAISLDNSSINNVVLEPGEQSDYRTISSIINKKKVEVDDYISWKDGIYMFRHQRLEDVMAELSRWYDVKVVFDNDNLKDRIITGRLKRKSSFSEFVKMVEVTQIATFKIKDNEIIIKE